MLLVLVSFWLSGTCGLIDLQVPRALCLVETWRTQGAALHHTGAWAREKVLARKTPSLLWGVRGSHLIVQPPGPRCRPHSEIWKGGGFPPWHRTSIFFVLVLVQSHLAPRLYTWPSPTGSGEPSCRGVSYKVKLLEILQRLGLNKHFLGVSQPWEEDNWISVHLLLNILSLRSLCDLPWVTLQVNVRWDLNADSMSWSLWLYRCFCSSVKFISFFFDVFVYGTVLFSLWWFIHILLHCWVY